MRRFSCLLLILLSQPLAAQEIAFIADLNGRYGSTSYDERVSEAIEMIVGMHPDLVISAGDMIAGQKQPRLDSDHLDRMWSAFNRVVADPLLQAGISLAVTPGNHDGSAFPEFALERQRFVRQWQARLPELDMLPGSEWPLRYAARQGTMLLLAFDGTRPGPLPETERQFVADMLHRYGSEAVLTIVYSHLPMWPLARGREHEIIADPELLAVLHSAGVDVYASGHHHTFFPGIDAEGMVHLGLGALGGNARAFSGEWHRQPHSFAVLHLDHDMLSVASLAAPGFDRPVPGEDLPATIRGPLGVLRRFEEAVPLRP